MIYEFYLDGILIRATRCEKDKQNFLHLYRRGYAANINLNIYSIFVMYKSDNSITFGLKRKWLYGKVKFKFCRTIRN